ncbi:hypothetical protein DFA_08907 [Cavenderia fasciculata]|uniref:Calcium-activated BK potassium channel n=1 Tax=Cavenderia fasciculata TaxID=261658 RepID=F4Q513_CACFS|nr:uncharacterized protein DFA_08907 [Cavenderia fasciculata]EGG17906.1 hypothetical protein DFA_08907 [Cavenderia fasciculata]|eukprot:XP_004356390.1 hypothetical protein DFA_08907 [Cavenderia fasciculata]
MTFKRAIPNSSTKVGSTKNGRQVGKVPMSTLQSPSHRCAVDSSSRTSRMLRKHNVKSSKISLRTRAEVYLTASGIIQWIEGIQTLLSIFSVIIFIYGTYLPLDKRPPLFYAWLELSLTVFFTLHWILDYFICKDRLKYLFSFFSLVDLVTVLPIYIDIANGGLFSELSTFQFLRVLRTVRVLRANRVLHYFEDITQYLFRVVIAIFTFILIVAAFYMNIDCNPVTQKPLEFHSTIYFLVVTLTTDGYGDIHPTNAVGMMTITFAICIGAVLIPYQVSKLLEKFSSYSPYKRDLSKENLHGHILLCGEINFTSLLEFLTEFYLEKYGQLKKTIVILNSKPPSDQLKILLLHPFYKNRLYYLEGQPMLESDLKRARFGYSSSCFVFRPMFWQEGDSNAILTALAMKNLKTFGPRIFTQLVQHESKYKISSNVKNVMCIEDFRNGILVQSTLCPGFGTLVCNLFTSRQPETTTEDEKWVDEYVNGSVNSIYKIPVPQALVGETLGYVTTTMYSGAKALVLGIIFDERETTIAGGVGLAASVSGLNRSTNSTPVGGIPGSPGPKMKTSGTGLPTGGAKTGKSSRLVLHPPFSTVLTASMQLIIIAHSPTAPVFKPNVPSIIRRLDDSSDEAQNSFLTNLYNRLFAPEEVRRGFQELNETSDNLFSDSVHTFFTSTYTSSPIEMDTFNSSTGVASTSSPSPPTSQHPTDPNNNNNSIFINDPNNNNTNTNTNTTNEMIPNINVHHVQIKEYEKPNPLLELCKTEFNNDWEEFLCTVVESVDAKKTHLQSIVDELEPIVRSIEKHTKLDNDDLYEEEEENNNWREHIIICGSINRIDLFLRGLRQKHIADHINHFYFIKNHQPDNRSSPPAIVILHPEEPDMSEWDDMDDIFFVKGSPLERKDLESVNIHLASKIIILSDPYTVHHNSSLTEQTSVQLDSDTIMAYLEINEMLTNKRNSSSFLTVELVHEPNIRFISRNTKSIGPTSKSRLKRENEEIEKPKYYITSEFASGKVLTLTTLDSLLCQSNHQEYLLDVAHELVLGVNGIKRYHQKFSNLMDSDSDSSGEEYYGGATTDEEEEGSHRLLHKTKMYRNLSRGSIGNNLASLGASTSGLIGGSPSGHEHSSCLLNQIKVPELFHGRTYGELFEGLIHKNILSLGLYRCKEITGAPNPYVFTCPPVSTILHENDLVYILYHHNQLGVSTSGSTSGEVSRTHSFTNLSSPSVLHKFKQRM